MCFWHVPFSVVRDSEKNNNTCVNEFRSDWKKPKELRISSLQQAMHRLTWQITTLEENFYVREKRTKESHLNECALWRWRCLEKNRLIQLLALRIAHLSVTDTQGYFVDGILGEIGRLEEKKNAIDSIEISNNNHCHSPYPVDFTCASLASFLSTERRRVMVRFKLLSCFVAYRI